MTILPIAPSDDPFYDTSVTDGEEHWDDGLESEDDDLLEQITEPFDPSKIKIITSPIVAQQIIDRIKYDALDLAPDFQRRSGIWKDMDKSRLIESLLLRIPIPVFYVAADKEDNWFVVDGVQRMSTINDYATDKFALKKLEYLTQFEDLKFSALPRNMQRRIGETQLTVNIMQPGTPEEVMFNVFRRINTAGEPLTGQEIRHALNPGPVRDYLKCLAETDEFIEATSGSVKPDRMDDRHCVLRFLAFHITPPEKYSGSDLDGYLSNAMKKINDIGSVKRMKIADSFKNAMRAAYQIFESETFRKPRGGATRRRRINIALFEAWSVQLAKCTPEQIVKLIERRDEVQRRFQELMWPGSDLERAVSASTASARNVHKRFQIIGELIEEFA